MQFTLMCLNSLLITLETNGKVQEFCLQLKQKQKCHFITGRASDDGMSDI